MVATVAKSGGSKTTYHFTVLAYMVTEQATVEADALEHEEDQELDMGGTIKTINPLSSRRVALQKALFRI